MSFWDFGKLLSSSPKGERQSEPIDALSLAPLTKTKLDHSGHQLLVDVRRDPLAHWSLPSGGPIGATVVAVVQLVPSRQSLPIGFATASLTKKSDHYPLGAIAILLFGGLEKVLHFPRE